MLHNGNFVFYIVRITGVDLQDFIPKIKNKTDQISECCTRIFISICIINMRCIIKNLGI